MIITSSSLSNKNDDYEFRNWKYVTILIIIAYLNAIKNFCIDIDCIMFLMNRKWFHVLIFHVIIRKIVNSIIVKDIENKQHFNFDYAILDFYIESKIKKKFVIGHLKRNVHIMNDLKTKMLIDINIICSKIIIVNF